MVDINRAQRIGDQIRKELGRILLREVKDQRLKFIALTDVTVSRDLSHAKVFYSLIDDKNDKAEIAEALIKAAGFMRGRIADELHLRVTPKLRFVYDNSMEYGRHMSGLINAAIAKEGPKNTESDDDSGNASANKSEQNSGDEN